MDLASEVAKLAELVRSDLELHGIEGTVRPVDGHIELKAAKRGPIEKIEYVRTISDQVFRRRKPADIARSFCDEARKALADVGLE